MQALRLASRSAAIARPCIGRRTLTTATAGHVQVTSTTSQPAGGVASGPGASPVALSNVEAQWKNLSADEKLTVHEQLEALAQKDWKELSLDEKKAAYFVAFGPHGPRTPTSEPGDALKVFLYTLGMVGLGGLLFFGIKAISPAPPSTMTKEWQEASNERGLELKLNPITGLASEGYQGKGFVQTK